jgi:predicted PurR-regulated permease PerM
MRQREHQAERDRALVRQVLIVAAIVALPLLAWTVRTALLLAFAGTIVAVLLRALAAPLETRLGLRAGHALLLVCCLLGLFLAVVLLLVGGQMRAQVAALARRLPEAIARVEDTFGIALPSAQAVADGEVLDPAALGSLATQVAALGGVAVNGLSLFVIAVVGGVFLAADPALYRRGVVRLLPPARQPGAEETLLAAGAALRLWLGAQFVSMASVGVAAGLGCWALGLPSPLALGLFAGLAGFVPFLGAVAGAVPPMLLALAEGGMAVLWTALLFLAIQQVESNMVTPLVERRLVSLPPALLVFAVVAAGALLGLPGVLLGAPLTVVFYVLVKRLYVREALGQPTTVPGEDAA